MFIIDGYIGCLYFGVMSWYDLDLTFDLAVVTLIFKILSGIYLGSCKV